MYPCCGVLLGCSDVVEVGQGVSFRLPLMSVQVIASKYMNDEGEMEALTNTEWAEIGTPVSELVKCNTVTCSDLQYPITPVTSNNL